jgi:hypothetical protein
MVIVVMSGVIVAFMPIFSRCHIGQSTGENLLGGELCSLAVKP